MEIHLLGDLTIQLAGEGVPHLPTRKVTALLVYLTAEGAASHRRESLFSLLWPGMPEKSARHNLSQTSYQLGQFYGGLTDPPPTPLLLTRRMTPGNRSANPLSATTAR